MKWKSFTIDTTTGAEDFVCGMLGELGVGGIEIIDNVQISEEERKAQFIDILPELPKDEGRAQVRFYLEEDAEEEELLAKVRAKLLEMASYIPVGSGRITGDTTEDKDWMNNWKAFFKPFTVDDMLIRPTWEHVEKEADYPLVIQIDPGTAFGTGLHETTQLCMRQLRKYVNAGMTVFDVGCGSGILAILALKLGAKHVTCMDIDPSAVTATKENLQMNGLKDASAHIFCGNLLEGDASAKKAGFHCYDVVTANILADIIIPLAGVAGAHLKDNGVFITSGILYTKEDAVKEALLANGFQIEEITHQNDWVSITARK